MSSLVDQLYINKMKNLGTKMAVLFNHAANVLFQIQIPVMVMKLTTMKRMYKPNSTRSIIIPIISHSSQSLELWKYLSICRRMAWRSLLSCFSSSGAGSGRAAGPRGASAGFASLKTVGSPEMVLVVFVVESIKNRKIVFISLWTCDRRRHNLALRDGCWITKAEQLNVKNH